MPGAQAGQGLVAVPTCQDGNTHNLGGIHWAGHSEGFCVSSGGDGGRNDSHSERAHAANLQSQTLKGPTLSKQHPDMMAKNMSRTRKTSSAQGKIIISSIQSKITRHAEKQENTTR